MIINMKNKIISLTPRLRLGETRPPRRHVGRGAGVRFFQKLVSFLLIFSFVTSWSYGLLPRMGRYFLNVR